MRRIAIESRIRSGIAKVMVGVVMAIVMAAGVSPAEAKRRAHKGGGSWAPPFAAMVLDPTTDRVLYGVDVDGERHPASLTKVMTLFLLFEQIEKGALRLDSPLQVSAAAMNQAPSRLGVKKGDTITVDDAIKAIVTRSANDVAVVIAENIAGTEQAFAQRMTEKAASLGMRRTTFVNASGLPNKAQITTARDLAVLGKAVRDRFPTLFTYFATRSFEYAGAKVPSHNRLMNRLEGMDGIKTGFTNASGFNLLASVKRGDKNVIAVVMGGTTQKSRDDQMAELVNRYIDQAAPAPAAAMAFAPKDTSTVVAQAQAAFQPQAPAAAKPVVVAAAPAKPAPLAQASAAAEPLTTGSITPAPASVAAASSPSTLSEPMRFGMFLLIFAALMSAAGLVTQRRRLAFVMGDAAAVAIVMKDLAAAGLAVVRERVRAVRATKAVTAAASRKPLGFESTEPYLPQTADQPMLNAPPLARGLGLPARQADTAGPWMPSEAAASAR